MGSCPRSGRTTLSVAMLKGMIEMGHSAVIVFPTDNFARDAAHRHNLTPDVCMGFQRFTQTPSSWGLVILDGYHRMRGFGDLTAIEYTRHRMLTRTVGQLVLIP